MSTVSTIQELARQVRRDTLAILAAAPAEGLTWAPAGTSNHILWHAGHALWVVDLLCLQLLSGQSQLPPGWAERFGMNCRPVAQTVQWPARSEITALLERQLEAVLELVGRTSEERLAESADLSRGPASRAARVIHAFHDEAKHCGEMYLLWKLLRSGSA